MPQTREEEFANLAGGYGDALAEGFVHYFDSVVEPRIKVLREHGIHIPTDPTHALMRPTKLDAALGITARNQDLAWCSYAVVFPGHPWYGKTVTHPPFERLRIEFAGTDPLQLFCSDCAPLAWWIGGAIGHPEFAVPWVDYFKGELENRRLATADVAASRMQFLVRHAGHARDVLALTRSN